MHFFPKADAAPLPPLPDSPTLLPTTVGPIFDGDDYESPIEPWTPDTDARLYPSAPDPYAPAPIPKEPTSPRPRYVRPQLARYERLRLCMLWYYGDDFHNEHQLLTGLNEKAQHARDSTGWEFAVVGILDVHVYIRLATAGLPLGQLPRGETLCAHTVTQPPGNVFQLPNMMEDWRFRDSPYVEQGGLVAYAGVPLRILHESGEFIGLGSLCVASSTPQPPLSKQQQQSLTRLADWVVADMVQNTRTRRQRERHRMSELLDSLEEEPDNPQESVLRILRTAYPDESISIQSCRANEIYKNGRYSGLQSDLQNGLWEDTAYIDDFIASSNNLDTPEDTIVRFISTPCESKLGRCILAVSTKNFRRIFDDVDAWFVQSCASALTKFWQKRLLSEAIKVKETFLRGISHQLRTPLHGILGAAELLADDVVLAKDGKSSLYIDTISMAGRDLMSTVNSMITLNRWADVAVAERQYHVHNISDLETELVRGVSEVVRGCTASDASLFFHNHLPPDTSSLRTDLDLLRNSILPLITNAIQSTEDGVVMVTFSVQPGTTAVLIDVEDTGCGIQADHQKRIFQLYEKVGEHTTRAGLGLTLATKYSTLLQGSISLMSSEINRGSHFRATFQDMAHATPVVSSTPIISSLQHLPLNFRQLGADTYLLSNFAKFLIRSGLTPSGSSQDCFFILEHTRDSDETYQQLSLVPAEQAAICLVPASVPTRSLKPLPNVTFISAPFSTAKLLSGLHNADQSTTTPVQGLSESFATSMQISPPTLPAEDHSVRCLSSSGSHSDEADVSTDGSPFLEREQAAFGSESSSDDVLLPDDQVLSEIPAKPFALTRSARPLVLVVDDNVVNLRILQLYCKSRGLSYLSAVNGTQAVEMFSKHQATCGRSGASIELILMDLQMPVCDGLDATQQIRSLEKQKGWATSVLYMVTGQDSQDDREAASAAGADDYLVKPVGPKYLDSRLKESFPLFAY